MINISLAQYTDIRGHEKKFLKKRVGKSEQNFFSARVVNGWDEFDDRNIQ